MNSQWTGFHKKALLERRNQINLLYPEFLKDDSYPFDAGLENDIANNMVENCIGSLSLPLGLGLNFWIDGKERIVPMVIEEPSVIAAASSAAKTIHQYSLFNGFETIQCQRNITTGQIFLSDQNLENLQNVQLDIMREKDRWMILGNEYCPTLIARGGGIQNIETQIYSNADSNSFLVINVHLDACEAMGANTVTLISDALGQIISQEYGLSLGPCIVSNYFIHRLVTSEFKIPTEDLKYKGIPGSQIAQGIMDAVKWANHDIYRYSTHNKGIMNGIDAVALATGQDWRAIEASCHTFAKQNSLTKYWIDEKNVFHGQIQIPIPVGVQGGSINTNPVYKKCLQLLGNPNSKELSSILASVGLAQNFAALRALVSKEFIKGHMSLHARNIAIAAGCPIHVIPECVSFLIETKRIHKNAAKDYLQAHQLIHTIHQSQDNLSKLSKTSASIFYLEHGEASLHVAFESVSQPNYIQMNQTLSKELFGDKSHEWIVSTLCLLDKVRLNTHKPLRSNLLLIKKLKMISILINLLIQNVLMQHPIETRAFIMNLLSKAKSVSMNLDMEQDILKIAFSLLKALWQVFEWRVNEWVSNDILRVEILAKQREIMSYLIHGIQGTKILVRDLIECHSQRFQVRLFLLFDAISFDPHILNASLLRFLLSLGSYFEWKQALAHDISRCLRDYQSFVQRGLSPDGALDNGVVNGLLYWMQSQGNLNMHNITIEKDRYVREFISLFDQPMSILHLETLVDSNQIQNTISLYLEYYQVGEYF